MEARFHQRPEPEDKEMLLGVVADDLTGATDVALMISRQGMKTVQVIGVPSAPTSATPRRSSSR